ncbi:MULTISPECIES: hydroxylase [unclassified Streptomyces]|uniref:hydroxylase n=1 Tax=unclassified Streptomyces TaxID=2593676 RepID=UPI0007EDF9EE|nr:MULTISPECIES: hydroxylase [unclassified Streptomyces]MCP3767370.1 hydroxylase [Streptomyces sp. MAR25Y5]OBQ53663.1 hydroxylase [Streptomyces sp. H-KF8]
MHEVHERILARAEEIAAEAAPSDELGRLTDKAAEVLRSSGVIRMLQPAEFGGHEAGPVDFFRTLRDIGVHSSSAGWVAGVVGVHAFEVAQMDIVLQKEIWGEDPDTWIASPYAPLGRATPVEGGFRFSGRWPFSSGTDHCRWIILGGLIVDGDGRPVPGGLRHFVLPRKDYEIVQDSWDVVGLRGTGSKDIVIEDRFIPEHRILDPAPMEDGGLAHRVGRGDSPLYRMPFHPMFTAGITTATVAMAQGALAAFIASMRSRVTARGVKTADDPHQLAVLGRAISDLEAGEVQLFDDIERMWEQARRDERFSPEERLRVRRNQVRIARRAVDAVDELFLHAGGSALRSDSTLQRCWRDIHAAMNHASNNADPIYQAYGLNTYGHPLPASVLF